MTDISGQYSITRGLIKILGHSIPNLDNTLLERLTTKNNGNLILDLDKQLERIVQRGIIKEQKKLIDKVEEPINILSLIYDSLPNQNEPEKTQKIKNFINNETNIPLYIRILKSSQYIGQITFGLKEGETSSSFSYSGISTDEKGFHARFKESMKEIGIPTSPSIMYRNEKIQNYSALMKKIETLTHLNYGQNFNGLISHLFFVKSSQGLEIIQYDIKPSSTSYVEPLQLSPDSPTLSHQRPT